MSAGKSDYTGRKQAQFEYIMRMHLRAALGAIENQRARGWRVHPTYVYVDLTSGPGRYGDGLRGSPAIVRDIAHEYSMGLDAWLIESDRLLVRTLRAEMAGSGARILHGSYAERSAEIAEWGAHLAPARGAVYWDGNGGLLPVPTLRLLTDGPLRRVDIIAHVNATGGYKRTRELHPDRYLADDLAALGKSYWFIREPITGWHWTFVIGTHWPDFPALSKLGFWPLASARGQAVLHRLNLSCNERLAREQLRLLDSGEVATTWPS